MGWFCTLLSNYKPISNLTVISKISDCLFSLCFGHTFLTFQILTNISPHIDLVAPQRLLYGFYLSAFTAPLKHHLIWMRLLTWLKRCLTRMAQVVIVALLAMYILGFSDIWLAGLSQCTSAHTYLLLVCILLVSCKDLPWVHYLLCLCPARLQEGDIMFSTCMCMSMHSLICYQTSEHDILKPSEPISMQIGTCRPWARTLNVEHWAASGLSGLLH